MLLRTHVFHVPCTVCSYLLWSYRTHFIKLTKQIIGRKHESDTLHKTWIYNQQYAKQTLADLWSEINKFKIKCWVTLAFVYWLLCRADFTVHFTSRVETQKPKPAFAQKALTEVSLPVPVSSSIPSSVPYLTAAFPMVQEYYSFSL